MNASQVKEGMRVKILPGELSTATEFGTCLSDKPVNETIIVQLDDDSRMGPGDDGLREVFLESVEPSK